MPKRKDIRIVIRHSGLIRLGTNLLLFGFFLAAFYSADPSNTSWGLWPIATLRYAPIIASAVAALCFAVGMRGIPLDWPVLMVGAFGIACVGGGAYTLVTERASLMESFTGRGLCTITFIPAYLACLLPRERRHLAKRLSLVCTAIPTVMVLVLVSWRLGYRVVDLGHIYHMSAIYFCSAAGFAMADSRSTFRRSAAAFFAMASILTVKLTGFGFAVIIAALLWRLEILGRSREAGQRLMYRRVLATQVVLATATIAALAAITLAAYMPTGTREVRLQTYAQRLGMFLEDPVFGSFFTGSPIMEVGMLIIPSHSDLLDMLAFGGIVGAMLFYAPAVACLRHGWQSMARFAAESDGLSFFALTTALCFLWQSAANPVLGDPRFIPVYWLALGVLLADRVTYRRQIVRSKDVSMQVTRGNPFQPLFDPPPAFQQRR